MEAVPDWEPELAWFDVPFAEGATGFELEGHWPESIWILHAMYENPSLPADVTYDDVEKAALGAGLLEPLMIGDFDLSARSVDTGAPLGWTPRPGPDWRRLTWAAYARRTGIAPGSTSYPSIRWFPSGSWPIAVAPPPEGSLDEVSLAALLDVLARHSPAGASTICLAWYGAATLSADPELLRGPLRSVPDLVCGDAWPGTPNNLWPLGREWFVWTDWDLLATRVSGSPGLIADLRSAPELETFPVSPILEG